MKLPFAILLSTVVLGCGSTADDAASQRQQRPSDVEVAVARDGELPTRRVYLGQVRALARASLSVGAPGEVRSVSVRAGDRVSRGDVLARVDPTLAAAQVQSARATAGDIAEQLEQAKREASRLEGSNPEIVSALEVERAVSRAAALEAQQANARAVISTARESLSRHRVVAPFDGVVASRSVDPGDWVTPGAPLLELVGDRAVEVVVQVEPEIALEIASGQPATLLRGDVRIPASVIGVVRAVDPATRTVQVRLAPAEVPDFLIPGSILDVAFELERGGEGVIVPRDALVVGAVSSRVIVVADGKAEAVHVTILDRGVEEVRVRGEGLRAGAVVAVRGNDRLISGQAVRVVTQDGDAKSQ